MIDKDCPVVAELTNIVRQSEINHLNRMQEIEKNNELNCQKLDHIKDGVISVEKKIDSFIDKFEKSQKERRDEFYLNFASKEDLGRVEKVVYGAVGVICLAFLMAIVGLVVLKT